MVSHTDSVHYGSCLSSLPGSLQVRGSWIGMYLNGVLLYSQSIQCSTVWWHCLVSIDRDIHRILIPFFWVNSWINLNDRIECGAVNLRCQEYSTAAKISKQNINGKADQHVDILVKIWPSHMSDGIWTRRSLLLHEYPFVARVSDGPSIRRGKIPPYTAFQFYQRLRELFWPTYMGCPFVITYNTCCYFRADRQRQPRLEDRTTLPLTTAPLTNYPEQV